MSGALDPVNNMVPKQLYKEKQSTAPSCSTIAKITCVAFVIIAYFGQSFITQRPACVQWNKEMQNAEWWATKQKERYETALDTYHDRAKLNCDLEQSIPFMPRNPEVLEFCNEWLYPNNHQIEKIPSIWKIQYTKEDVKRNRDHCDEFQYSLKHRLAGMELSCFAKGVKTAKDVYERQEEILKDTLSGKPLLCSRVNKT